jgi:4a-hydroxytetrahydrobiopterin dehydratase
MALADERFTDGGKATSDEVERLVHDLPGWQVVNDGMDKLERDYTFDTFMNALNFANRVGAVAEEHGHHPQITFTWGAATVRWWSHSLGGLTRNDFIMAAKTDQLVE